MINNTQRAHNQNSQHSMQTIPSRMNNLFENRDVQRAGWLRYIPFAERYSASSDDHKFWVVFAVYNEQTPYLEFYQQRQPNIQLNPQSDGPVSKHSLLTCRHIQSVIEPSTIYLQGRYNEFSITLETHVIRLAADNDEVMFDWIKCLKTKLIEMNILPPMENYYSTSPELSSNRRNHNNNHSESNNQDVSTTSNNDEIYEPIFELSNRVHQIALTAEPGNVPAEEGPPPYECIFNNSNRNPHPLPDDNNIIHRPSFRETQVEKFKKEMGQIQGLTLKVRKKDCYNAVAFVDIHPYGIFIAGWKQKDHPHLHNTFHIGDQLVSINGTVLESAADTKQFIKHGSHHLNITIRRVPFGQIFCLKRSYDGEDLGLIREKGTAEIVSITPNSVAWKAEVPSKCNFYQNEADNDDDTHNQARSQNWFLTEINNRPLNLFFKNNEVSDRLNAIGKEISILIQPYGFIKRLKRQLKTIKNYKDFLVQ